MVMMKVYQKGTRPQVKQFQLTDELPMMWIPRENIQARKPHIHHKIVLGDYETVQTIPHFYCTNPRPLQTTEFTQFDAKFKQQNVRKYIETEAYLYATSYIETTDSANTITPKPIKVDSDVMNAAPYMFSTVSKHRCMSYVSKCVDFILSCYGIPSYTSNYDIPNLAGLMGVLPSNVTLYETNESCSDLTILYQETQTKSGPIGHVGIYHKGQYFGTQPITHVTKKFVLCVNTNAESHDETFYQTKTKEVKSELNKLTPYTTPKQGTTQFLTKPSIVKPVICGDVNYSASTVESIKRELPNAEVLIKEMKQVNEPRQFWPVDPTSVNSRAILNSTRPAAFNIDNIVATIDPSQIPNCSLDYTNQGQISWGQPNCYIQGFAKLTRYLHAGDCLKNILKNCCLKCYDDLKAYLFDQSNGPIQIHSQFTFHYLQHIIMTKAWCPQCEFKLINQLTDCTCKEAHHDIRKAMYKWQQLHRLNPSTHQFGTLKCGNHTFKNQPNSNYSNVEIPYSGRSFPSGLNYHHYHANITQADVHTLSIRKREGKTLKYMNTECFGNEWQEVKRKPKQRQNGQNGQRQNGQRPNGPQNRLMRNSRSLNILGNKFTQTTCKFEGQLYSHYHCKETEETYVFQMKKNKGKWYNFESTANEWKEQDGLPFTEYCILPEVSQPNNCQEFRQVCLDQGLVEAPPALLSYLVPQAYYVLRQSGHFALWNSGTGIDVCTGTFIEFAPYSEIERAYVLPESFVALTLLADVPLLFEERENRAIPKCIEETEQFIDDTFAISSENEDEEWEEGSEVEESLEYDEDQKFQYQTPSPAQTETINYVPLNERFDLSRESGQWIFEFLTQLSHLPPYENTDRGYLNQFELMCFETMIKHGLPATTASQFTHFWIHGPNHLKYQLAVPAAAIVAHLDDQTWFEHISNQFVHCKMLKPYMCNYDVMDKQINAIKETINQGFVIDTPLCDYPIEEERPVPVVDFDFECKDTIKLDTENLVTIPESITEQEKNYTIVEQNTTHFEEVAMNLYDYVKDNLPESLKLKETPIKGADFVDVKTWQYKWIEQKFQDVMLIDVKPQPQVLNLYQTEHISLMIKHGVLDCMEYDALSYFYSLRDSEVEEEPQRKDWADLLYAWSVASGNDWLTNLLKCEYEYHFDWKARLLTAYNNLTSYFDELDQLNQDFNKQEAEIEDYVSPQEQQFTHAMNKLCAHLDELQLNQLFMIKRKQYLDEQIAEQENLADQLEEEIQNFTSHNNIVSEGDQSMETTHETAQMDNTQEEMEVDQNTETPQSTEQNVTNQLNTDLTNSDEYKIFPNSKSVLHKNESYKQAQQTPLRFGDDDTLSSTEITNSPPLSFGDIPMNLVDVELDQQTPSASVQIETPMEITPPKEKRSLKKKIVNKLKKTFTKTETSSDSDMVSDPQSYDWTKPPEKQPKRPPINIWVRAAKELDFKLSSTKQVTNYPNVRIGDFAIVRVKMLNIPIQALHESRYLPTILEAKEIGDSTFLKCAFPDKPIPMTTLNCNSAIIRTMAINIEETLYSNGYRPAKFNPQLTYIFEDEILCYDFDLVNFGFVDSYAKDIATFWDLDIPFNGTKADSYNTILALYGNQPTAIEFNRTTLKGFILQSFAHQNGLEILTKLGKGSFGSAYLCDSKRGFVVLKMQTDAEAWENEIAAMQIIENKQNQPDYEKFKVNTTKIYHWGDVPCIVQYYFTVMEFVDAWSIDVAFNNELLKDLPIETKLNILDHHEKTIAVLNEEFNIDHNDHHTQNILLTKQDLTYYLIDWGCSVDYDADLTPARNVAYLYDLACVLLLDQAESEPVNVLIEKMKDYNQHNYLYHPDFAQFKEHIDAKFRDLDFEDLTEELNALSQEVEIEVPIEIEKPKQIPLSKQRKQTMKRREKQLVLSDTSSLESAQPLNRKPRPNKVKRAKLACVVEHSDVESLHESVYSNGIDSELDVQEQHPIVIQCSEQSIAEEIIEFELDPLLPTRKHLSNLKPTQFGKIYPDVYGYDEFEQFGNGTQSKCYTDGNLVIKVIEANIANDNELNHTMFKEWTCCEAIGIYAPKQIECFSTRTHLFYVMEKVKGKALINIPPKEFTQKDINAFNIFMRNCLTTFEAHDIYHADLNGGNVFYEQSTGLFYLIDYGICVTSQLRNLCLAGFLIVQHHFYGKQRLTYLAAVGLTSCSLAYDTCFDFLQSLIGRCMFPIDSDEQTIKPIIQQQDYIHLITKLAEFDESGAKLINILTERYATMQKFSLIIKAKQLHCNTANILKLFNIKCVRTTRNLGAQLNNVIDNKIRHLTVEDCATLLELVLASQPITNKGQRDPDMNVANSYTLREVWHRMKKYHSYIPKTKFFEHTYAFGADLDITNLQFIGKYPNLTAAIGNVRLQLNLPKQQWTDADVDAYALEIETIMSYAPFKLQAAKTVKLDSDLFNQLAFSSKPYTIKGFNNSCFVQACEPILNAAGIYFTSESEALLATSYKSIQGCAMELLSCTLPKSVLKFSCDRHPLTKPSTKYEPCCKQCVTIGDPEWLTQHGTSFNILPLATPHGIVNFQPLFHLYYTGNGQVGHWVSYERQGKKIIKHDMGSHKEVESIPTECKLTVYKRMQPKPVEITRVIPGIKIINADIKSLEGVVVNSTGVDYRPGGGIDGVIYKNASENYRLNHDLFHQACLDRKITTQTPILITETNSPNFVPNAVWMFTVDTNNYLTSLSQGLSHMLAKTPSLIIPPIGCGIYGQSIEMFVGTVASFAKYDITIATNDPTHYAALINLFHGEQNKTTYNQCDKGPKHRLRKPNTDVRKIAHQVIANLSAEIVVDLGIGHGGDLMAYKSNKKIGKVVGVDNAVEALKECARRMEANHMTKVNILEMDMHSRLTPIWLKEQNADVWFSDCALHYFDLNIPTDHPQIHIIPYYNTNYYHLFSDYFEVTTHEVTPQSVEHTLSNPTIKFTEVLHSIDYWQAKFPYAKFTILNQIKPTNEFLGNYMLIDATVVPQDDVISESESQPTSQSTEDSLGDIEIYDAQGNKVKVSELPPLSDHSSDSHLTTITEESQRSSNYTDEVCKYSIQIHGDYTEALDIKLLEHSIDAQFVASPTEYCIVGCSDCKQALAIDDLNSQFPQSPEPSIQSDEFDHIDVKIENSNYQLYITPDSDTIKQFDTWTDLPQCHITTKIDSLDISLPTIICAAIPSYAHIIYNTLKKRGFKQLTIHKHVIPNVPSTDNLEFHQYYKSFGKPRFLDVLSSQTAYIHYKSATDEISYTGDMQSAITTYLNSHDLPYSINYRIMANHVWISPKYDNAPIEYKNVLNGLDQCTHGNVAVKVATMTNGTYYNIVYTSSYVAIYFNDVLVKVLSKDTDSYVCEQLTLLAKSDLNTLDLVAFYGVSRPSNFPYHWLLLAVLFFTVPFMYILGIVALMMITSFMYKFKYKIVNQAVQCYSNLRGCITTSIGPHVRYNYNKISRVVDIAFASISSLFLVLIVRAIHYDTTVIKTNKPAYHTMFQTILSALHIIPSLNEYTQALTLKSLCSGVLCRIGRPYNHHFLDEYVAYNTVKSMGATMSFIKTILSYTPITIWFKGFNLELWQLVLLNLTFCIAIWYCTLASRPCCKATGPYCPRHANLTRTTFSYCVDGKQYYFQNTRTKFCTRHNWWCDHNGHHILPKPIANVIQDTYSIQNGAIKGDDYYQFINTSGTKPLPSIGKDYNSELVYHVNHLSYHTWTHLAAYYAFTTGKIVKIATVDVSDCTNEPVSFTHNFKDFLSGLINIKYVEYVSRVKISDRNVMHINMFTQLTTQEQNAINSYVSQTGDKLNFTNIEYDDTYDGMIPLEFDIPGPSIPFHTKIINIDSYGALVSDAVRKASQNSGFRMYKARDYRHITTKVWYCYFSAAFIAVLALIIALTPSIRYNGLYAGLNPSGLSCRTCPLYFHDTPIGEPVALAVGNPIQAYLQHNGTYLFTKTRTVPSKTECTMPKYHLYQHSTPLECGGYFPTVVDLGFIQLTFMLHDGLYHTPHGSYNIEDPTTCITLMGQTHCHITPMQLTPTKFTIYLTLLLAALIFVLYLYMRCLKIFGVYTYDVMQLCCIHIAVVIAYWFMPLAAVMVLVAASFAVTIKPFIFYGYVFFVMSFICGCPIFVIALYFLIFATYYYYKYALSNTGVSIGCDGVVFSSNYSAVATSTFFVNPTDLYKVSVATGKSIAEIVQLSKGNLSKPDCSLAYNLCKAHTENRTILYEGTVNSLPVRLQSIMLRVSDVVIPQATRNIVTIVENGEVVGHGIYTTPTTVLTARHVPTANSQIQFEGRTIPILKINEIGFNSTCITPPQSVKEVKMSTLEYSYKNNLSHFTTANGVRYHSIYMSPSGHIPFADTFPGESGSPIFSGNVLVGIHQGIVNQGGVHGIITDPFGIPYDPKFHDTHGTVGPVVLSANRHYESFNVNKAPIDLVTFDKQLAEVTELYAAKPLFDTFDRTLYTGTQAVDLSDLIHHLKTHGIIKNLSLPSLQSFKSSYFSLSFTNIFSMWLALCYILHYTFSDTAEIYDIVMAVTLGLTITAIFRFKNALFTITSGSYIINKIHVFIVLYISSILNSNMENLHFNLYDGILIFFIFAFIVYKLYNSFLQTVTVVIGYGVYLCFYPFTAISLAYVIYIIIAPASLFTALSLYMLQTPFAYYWICVNLVLSLRIVYPKWLRNSYANLTCDVLLVPHQYLCNYVSLTGNYPNYVQCFLATLFYDNDDVVKFRPQSSRFYINTILGLETKTNNVERKSAAMMSSDEDKQLNFLLEALYNISGHQLQSKNFLDWVSTVTEIETLTTYLNQNGDSEDKDLKKNCNIVKSRIAFLEAQERKFLKQIELMHQDEVKSLIRTENVLKLSGMLKNAVERLVESANLQYRKLGYGIIAASTARNPSVLSIMNKDADVSVIFGDDNVILFNNEDDDSVSQPILFSALKNNAGDPITNESEYSNLKPSDYPLLAHLITPLPQLQANVGYVVDESNIKVTINGVSYKNKPILTFTDVPSDMIIMAANKQLYCKIENQCPPAVMLKICEAARHYQFIAQSLRLGGIPNATVHEAISDLPLRTEGYITYVGESICQECCLGIASHNCKVSGKFVQLPSKYAANPMGYFTTHKPCIHNKFDHECEKFAAQKAHGHHHQASKPKLTAAERYLALKQQLKN